MLSPLPSPRRPAVVQAAPPRIPEPLPSPRRPAIAAPLGAPPLPPRCAGRAPLPALVQPRRSAPGAGRPAALRRLCCPACRRGLAAPLKPWVDPRELASALEGWDTWEVAELEAAGIVWTPRLVCKLLRAFKKAEMAWEFFCWVACRPGGFAHDRHTVARMVAILARAGHVELVERLLAKLRSDGILLPIATVRLVIDFYGLSKKADAAARVFRDAECICGPVSRPNLALLCSSLRRTMAKSRRGLDAMELLEEMMARGVLPDLQTSGVMEHVAGDGDLRGVQRLLGLVRQCELRPDGYMYSVLVRAYASGSALRSR